MTVQMFAPPGTTVFYGRSGKAYNPSNISVVAIDNNDVPGALNAGFVTCGPANGNYGTVPASGVTAVELGNESLHHTILTVSGLLIPSVTGSLGVGVLLYTLPAGAIVLGSLNMGVSLTTAGAASANTPTVGLGTTIASGAVVVLSGTAAFQNIMVGTATADCAGTVLSKTSLATASPFGLVIEAAAGLAHTVYFNAACAWTGTDATIKLNGTIVLEWSFFR